MKNVIDHILWLAKNALFQIVLLEALFIKLSIDGGYINKGLWTIYLQILPLAGMFLVVSFLAYYLGKRYPLYPQFRRKSPDNRNANQIAAHEAGHLLGLALFDAPPEGLCINLRERPIANIVIGGYIQYNSYSILTKRDLMATIQTLLAASCAEELLLKETYLGLLFDSQEIEFAVRRYLDATAGLETDQATAWLRLPQDQDEKTVNAKTLNNFIGTTRSKTMDFLIENEDVLKEVYDELRHSGKREFNNPWCQQVIARVRVPIVTL